MSRFFNVAKASHISDEMPLCVTIEGRQIALFRLGDRIYAIDDACTHEGGPLTDGFIEGEEVECPWHGARFNIRTGAPCCPPGEQALKTYNVRLSGDDVEVEV